MSAPATWLDRLRALYGTDTAGLEHAVAHRLFLANNRSRGAVMDFGLGLLDDMEMRRWIDRARRLLAVDLNSEQSDAGVPAPVQISEHGTLVAGGSTSVARSQSHVPARDINEGRS